MHPQLLLPLGGALGKVGRCFNQMGNMRADGAQDHTAPADWQTDSVVLYEGPPALSS